MNDNEQSMIVVTMVSHCLVHTYELSVPILMTVWLDQFPVTEFWLGTVVTFGFALFGLGSIPGGVLADYFDSSSILALCLLGMGSSFFVLGLAPGLWGIGSGLVLWGIAASVHHPAALSLISTGIEQRGTGFAYHGMAGNAGIALGPFLTSLLLMFLSWRYVAGFLAIPAFMAAGYAYSVEFDQSTDVEFEKKVEISSLSEFFSKSKTLLLSAFGIVFAMVILEGLYYRGILTFLPELLAERPELQSLSIGALDFAGSRYLYAGLLLFGVIGQFIGGKLTDVISPVYGLGGVLLGLGAIALLFIQFISAPIEYLIGLSLVLGVVLFLAQPLYQATVAEYTSQRIRGMAYGFTFLGIFGLGSLGASIGGFLLTFFDPSAFFLFLSGLAFIGVILSGVLLSRPKPSGN